MEQPEKTVLVYVFDGFADWESAYVCAELGRAENPRTVRAVAADREPIRSMGGLTVLPDCTVAEAPERTIGKVVLLKMIMAIISI